MICVTHLVEQTFRNEGDRVLASLIASIGDFTLAEDALQDALVAALQQWPREGVPQRPAAWLITIGRRKAIDRLRRAATLQRKHTTLQTLATLQQQDAYAPPNASDTADAEYPDERLKLLFTCCHPALALEARVALTLKTLGGLSTDEIARAFLVPPTTMAQRLHRAKRKIHDADIRYRVPVAHELPDRLDAVLATLYLIFNAGYATLEGPTLIHSELCSEAIRLTRALTHLLAQDPHLPVAAEALGLLALLLLIHARRLARVDAAGDLITLDEQDRTHWLHDEIAEGLALLDRALLQHRPGPYQIQAAINALHAQAASPADTDWREIALLYEALMQCAPSPIVELNRAVAIAMAHGPERGLTLLAQLHTLDAYHPLHAARAELRRRAGQHAAAITSYQQALALCQNTTERRYLQRRIAELAAASHLNAPPVAPPPTPTHQLPAEPIDVSVGDWLQKNEYLARS